jgi:hypothetical protein
VTVDTSGWSGDGDLTTAIVEALQTIVEVAFVRVEDATSSRSDAGYAFLSNEVYVSFAMRERRERARRLGIVPWVRRVAEPALTLEGLEARLARLDRIGPADYADEGLIQYLRTQRIVAPYQTKGIKLVELVRIYQVR